MEEPKSGTRRLIRIGGSVGITLPPKHLKRMGWKVGDKIGMVYDDVLVMVKPTLKKEE